MLRSKASRWAAAPYLVWMVLFIVVPLGIVVWYALTNSDGQVTLANLTSIGRYASVFGRSLLLAAEATIICLVLAFPVGYFLSRLRANKQHIMLMLVMLPMWMNFLLRTYAWMTLLEKNGLINKLLGLFGIGPFNMINTSGAVVLGMVYNYLPYMILPLYSVIMKIDNRLIEAALDLGATPHQALHKVILPEIMPGIVTGAIMAFTMSIDDFVVSYFTAGTTSQPLSVVIYSMTRHRMTPKINAISTILFLIVLALLIVINMRQSRDEKRREAARRKGAMQP